MASNESSVSITEIFSQSEFKPLVRYNRVVDGYYVAKDGRFYSTKTNKVLKPYTAHEKSGRVKEQSYSLSIPYGFFPEHPHKKREGRNVAKTPLSAHRAVAETWMPVDTHPPEELADEWFEVITPEMVGQLRIPPKTRQWVKDTVVVDHKDDDPTNNSLDNLRYVTPKKNNSRRKELEMKLLAEKRDSMSEKDFDKEVERILNEE
ncbi:HNH endonuclease [Synechococcus phage S-8S29]|nr:HNH endonuclease [Synechococcus phage S-8S29]